MVLNDWWVNKEIRQEIRKFLEPNENENAVYQYLCNKTKKILRKVYSYEGLYSKKLEDLKLKT
jgi:hypothetical protein